MQVRVATAADAAEIAGVHVASWQAAYRGQMPDSILDNLDVRRRIVRWQEILAQPNGVTSVAVDEARLIGFSNLIPSRDTDADSKAVAELAAIYVHPDLWHKGIGRELCHRALQEAENRGFAEVTLWVLKTNLPAIKFYQAMNFVPDGATKTDKLNDFDLHELRLRRPF
jgi:GNAT superfamily N-acetyltransferase